MSMKKYFPTYHCSIADIDIHCPTHSDLIFLLRSVERSTYYQIGIPENENLQTCILSTE